MLDCCIDDSICTSRISGICGSRTRLLSLPSVNREPKSNGAFVALSGERNSAMRRADLADLAAFVAVADNLSFRAAAARLGVTPSALSHTMRHFEERLGFRLLNRTTRSVSLTDAGLRLLDRLRPAVEQISRGLDDLKGEQGHPFGRLRLYVTHLAGAAVIAPSGRAFYRPFPTSNLKSTPTRRRATSSRRGSMLGSAQKT